MPGTILTVLRGISHLTLGTALLGRAIILLHRGQGQAPRSEVTRLRSQLMKAGLEKKPLECGPEAELLSPKLPPFSLESGIFLHTPSAPYSVMTLGQSCRQPRAESAISEGGGVDSGTASPVHLSRRLPRACLCGHRGLPDSSRWPKSLQQHHGMAPSRVL